METTDLSSAAYWESGEIDIRLNPKRVADASGLHEFLSAECGVESSVVMATSGSSGNTKFVVLPKMALLASARAVNAHGGLTHEDIWLAGLSTFHVGGMGIFARAFTAGSQVVPMAWDFWKRDGSALIEAILQSGATLTSLTPVHLSDLVTGMVPCPETLRGVFLGGGRIREPLVDQARELGWPLWTSYGMSEASSQIATSLEGRSDWLTLLPIWECRTDHESRLSIRGEALFSGYATKENGRWSFDSARDGSGWFVTGDCVELDGGALQFLGRADDLVKVSGELISLSFLNARIEELGYTGAVVALPESRRENELVLVVESGSARCLDELNEGLTPIEQVSRVFETSQLPRTDLGKLDLRKIAELAESAQSSHPTG